MIWNESVGIVAIELYIPIPWVDQAALETHMGTAKGKVTKGLGQDQMSFVGPLEDANSMGLTVLRRLMTRLALRPDQIGKLEFATETLHDKSKSAKTILMSLFKEHKDVEGVTHVNACYGGTSALFDCLAWTQTHQGRGRYAVVVMADVAVYDDPKSLVTGGAGAVALLIGQKPAIVFSELRASYSDDQYDFYKPKMESEYPVVNGQLSTNLYDQALRESYSLFKKKAEAVGERFRADMPDFFCLHCPFAKQVEKGFLRILHTDLN